MSDTSSNIDVRDGLQPTTKRKPEQAGFPVGGPRPKKSVKRRASKACQCCRARKVRCNVVEQIPCTNCRLDEVECIVSESKRKKKWSKLGDEVTDFSPTETTHNHGRAREQSVMSASTTTIANQASSKLPEHIPHSLYQDLDRTTTQPGTRRHTFSDGMQTSQIATNMSDLNRLFEMNQPVSPVVLTHHLPAYIKPLPPRVGQDEIDFLTKKGALTIPPLPLRNALLGCFAEYVHPFMPMTDLHDMIDSIDRNDGSNPISLLLFQAVMFSGVATVGMQYLTSAGYESRRDARRDFFQRTRLLYDFDYELDRISLIQALLLMTYWYETPDDQKDSHHWMGIAVSLSHTIGLHRNPDRTNMDTKRRRLWKRIWWSTYMRDRLIALGMRRPTRIKNEDFDVPALVLDDFQIKALAPGSSIIPPSCSVMRNVARQRDLAVMCIEKAKLCICISHVLSTQYSVLHNNQGELSKEGSTRTTMMLVANKDEPGATELETCDEELRQWKESMAPEAVYVQPTSRPADEGEQCMILNRSLLHMVYYSTLSALHRPQVLPSTPFPANHPGSALLEISRNNVRHAAFKITEMAETLYDLDLVRFLPTVGITVLLPAIIIHLLDIKAPDESTRRASLQGFCTCMQILNKLRDVYAAADYSTAFLEAAIRKADIALPPKADRRMKNDNIDPALTVGRDELHPRSSHHLTPPPEQTTRSVNVPGKGRFPLHNEDALLARKLNTFLSHSPRNREDHPLEPRRQVVENSDKTEPDWMNAASKQRLDMSIAADFEPDFDALVNLDAAGEAFALEDGNFGTDGGFMGMPFASEGGGIDWLKGLQDDDMFPEVRETEVEA